ncbi:MAG: hypothetical protein ABIJ18_01975 [archaeon]
MEDGIDPKSTMSEEERIAAIATLQEYVSKKVEVLYYYRESVYSGNFPIVELKPEGIVFQYSSIDDYMDTPPNEEIPTHEGLWKFVGEKRFEIIIMKIKEFETGKLLYENREVGPNQDEDLEDRTLSSS